MRRLLVVLDNSKPGLNAQHFAINLAKKNKAFLTGIGILDTPWITAAQLEPLGGSAFKIQRDEAIMEHSHHHVAFLRGEFQVACEKKGVPCQSFKVEGFPALEVEKLAHEHDLIIMGKTTDLHFELEEDSDIVVMHIAREASRPLFLISETLSPREVAKSTEEVMVAFNGGVQSSRAIHMFILLGLATNKNIHIVSIDKEIEIAQAHTKRAFNLFKAYGIEASCHPLTQKGSLEDQLLRKSQDLKATMLVMGGFSHTALRETFFGSTTKAMMRGFTYPIFMHH